MEFTGKEAVCLGIFLVVLFSIFNSWAFYVLITFTVVLLLSLYFVVVTQNGEAGAVITCRW